MINESFLDLAQQGKPRGTLKKETFQEEHVIVNVAVEG